MHNIIIRKSDERGFFNHDWLKTYHTFSFSEYYDEQFMNYHSLMVINDDTIKPNTGFGLHPHKNMEIITYVLSGTLTHSDNLGNKEEIKAGCFQVMSAGTGIVHGEFNHGNVECHLLQMWISPNRNGGEPYYKISKPNHFERWALVASDDGIFDSVQIRQNAQVFAIDSGNLKETQLPSSKQQHFWLHLASGSIKLGNLTLNAGDAIGFNNTHFKQSEKAQDFAKIEFLEQSRVVLFALFPI